MFSKPQNHPWTPSTRQYRDERSPHTTTRPIRINDGRIYKPFPSILLNGDTTPGTIHHGRAHTTDYTVWDCGHKIAVDEARITARRAPEGWVERVGMRPEEGRELKVVVRREVRIVPEGEGEFGREVGVGEGGRKGEGKVREGMVGRDSGYGSGEEQLGTEVLEDLHDDGNYSVWSCC